MRPWALVSFALAVLLTACGTQERGEKRIGDPCSEASECRHALCVGGVAGDAPVCTRSCASAADCPRGWSCGGVTGDNVVICTRGASNPFGIGARE